MQKEERLMAVVAAVGMLTIGVLLSVWVLFIGTASTRTIGFAATPEMVLDANEPEMVLEESAVEAEPEEPEVVAEEQEAVEVTEVAETEPIVYEAEESAALSELSSWRNESVITPGGGVNDGPSGYETYYNLPMEGVVSLMRDLGYDAGNYPYWVRDDGAKMFGPYVMVAAELNLRPKGTVLESSLGTAMVCDTGSFAAYNPTRLDIAVTW